MRTPGSLIPAMASFSRPLRARHLWPSACRAAEKCDELAPPHARYQISRRRIVPAQASTLLGAETKIRSIAAVRRQCQSWVIRVALTTAGQFRSAFKARHDAELLAGQSYGRRLDRVVWRIHHDAFRSQWTRMINAALALLILILGLVGPATAAELDDAVAAAHRGEYATALRRLSPLAEKGDARAQFDIGFMHAYGWGVPRNPAEAITWYRKAADQGLPIAQHFLGMVHANGEGVRPDDAEAARWFARAAAQGFAQAQFMLGLMSLDGRGVPKDQVQGYAFMVMGGQGGVRSA